MGTPGRRVPVFPQGPWPAGPRGVQTQASAWAKGCCGGCSCGNVFQLAGRGNFIYFHRFHLAVYRIYGIISGIKDYELNGIESFVNELLKIKNSITIVNNYYLGYSIPQIGKEFDLLRFGDNYIINIEIKTESSIDKIFTHQQQN